MSKMNLFPSRPKCRLIPVPVKTGTWEISSAFIRERERRAPTVPLHPRVAAEPNTRPRLVTCTAFANLIKEAMRPMPPVWRKNRYSRTRTVAISSPGERHGFCQVWTVGIGTYRENRAGSHRNPVIWFCSARVAVAVTVALPLAEWL